MQNEKGLYLLTSNSQLKELYRKKLSLAENELNKYESGFVMFHLSFNILTKANLEQMKVRRCANFNYFLKRLQEIYTIVIPFDCNKIQTVSLLYLYCLKIEIMRSVNWLNMNCILNFYDQ